MNKIAAIFTSVYNALKKVCIGVKSNYVSSKDEEKTLWIYFTQFFASLFGIGILTLLFIFWTDHQEHVVLINVENHGPYSDSCYLSFAALTGESSSDSKNPYGYDGKVEQISLGITAKEIGKRYGLKDIVKAAEERNIEIDIDSIKQDSCAQIITFNNYTGSNILNDGFFHKAANRGKQNLIQKEFLLREYNLEAFNNPVEIYIPNDSVNFFYIGSSSYNREIKFENGKCLWIIGKPFPFKFVYPSYSLNLNAPSFYSWTRRGDLSTLNYTLLFDLQRIDLEKVSFNFKTPTIVSKIYPEPDALDLYQMNYTDPKKISHIKNEGLSFEMEFVSGKSLQDFRMNVLIMIMSILITYALTIFIRVMIILTKSVHLGKDAVKFITIFPVVILFIVIFVSKIVNMVYASWTKTVYYFLTAGLLWLIFYKMILPCKLRIKDNPIYYVWLIIVFIVYYSLFIFIYIFLRDA